MAANLCDGVFDERDISLNMFAKVGEMQDVGRRVVFQLFSYGVSLETGIGVGAIGDEGQVLQLDIGKDVGSLHAQQRSDDVSVSREHAC